MDISIPQQAVARGLRRLEAAIAELVEALAHRAVRVQMETAREDGPVRTLCEAYSAINYAMDEEIGSSVVCLGVGGVSADILRTAQAVNLAKAELKTICAPLYGVRIRIPVKGDESTTEAVPLIRVILRRIQRSDLNLLAAYRKIPILDSPPATVTYTRANTRAVYRKSLEDIGTMLSQSNGPAAAGDRARLAALGRDETHLALVKERYPNMRANVLYAHLDPRGRGRIQISAELPILFAMGRRTQFPEVTFPAPVDIANLKVKAREALLEPRPFLQSLPVYRYAQQPTPRQNFEAGLRRPRSRPAL